MDRLNDENSSGATTWRSDSNREMISRVLIPDLTSLTATRRRTGSFLLSQPDFAHAALPYFLEQFVSTNRHPGGLAALYGSGRFEPAFDEGVNVRVTGFDGGTVLQPPIPSDWSALASISRRLAWPYQAGCSSAD